MVKLVIFDLDGVIVSTDDLHYRAWKRVSDELNLLFNEEINHKLRGVSREESLKIILNLNSRTLTGEEFKAVLEMKNHYYRSSLCELTSKDILPGVSKYINHLKTSGIKLAIGSSSRNSPLILKQIGLDESFDTVVDGNSITRSKPDPEVFLKAAEDLGIDPLYSIVYEDAQAGVDAALAAGMKVIGVGKEALTGAYRVTENMLNESVELLGGMYE